MSARSGFLRQALAGFGRLSSRERVLVAITLVAAIAFVFFGGVYMVSSRLEKAERRLRERTQQLGQILGLESRYAEAKRQRERTLQRLTRNNVQLFSLLPKVAGELGLELNDLNERRTPLKESGVDEISVDVNLKKMSIDKLDGFLQRIEQAGQRGMVKVLKIKVKTRYDNPQLLDVNMKVATYRTSSPG